MRKRKSTNGKKKILDGCNKKKLKIEYDGDEDRLSKLPEEIFGRVVSFLPLRDAVATSSISRQWRSVWSFTGTLNFDGDDTVKRLSMEYYFNFDKLNMERDRFIKWVNGVIKQYAGELDLFKVYFDLDCSSTSIIDGWMQFAMEKRAKALELEFLDQGFPRRSDAYILKREIFEQAKNVEWFSCVKVLDLRSVTLGGDLMEYLLSKCPNLEGFHVHMSSEVVNLRIHGPLSALKHLTIYDCEKIRSVEIIDASNLVSFYFDCMEDVSPPKLVIRNVPMLVDVYVHIHNFHLKTCIPLVFDILSSCLSQLHILQLNVSCEVYLDDPPYPMLPNLKELRLIISQLGHRNLLHVISFMKLSPSLTKLLLKLVYLKRGRGRLHKLVKPSICHNLHNLKELEVQGYCSTEIESLVYLMKNAVSLEKLVINPCIYFSESMVRLQYYNDSNEGEEQVAREHALKHLKNKVGSNTKFVCL